MARAEKERAVRQANGEEEEDDDDEPEPGKTSKPKAKKEKEAEIKTVQVTILSVHLLCYGVAYSLYSLACDGTSSRRSHTTSTRVQDGNRRNGRNDHTDQKQARQSYSCGSRGYMGSLGLGLGHGCEYTRTYIKTPRIGF